MVPDIHAKFHNQPFIMRRAIWRHVRGHTDSLSHTHSHTIKPPTAGVQLVGHTSIIKIIILYSYKSDTLMISPQRVYWLVVNYNVKLFVFCCCSVKTVVCSTCGSLHNRVSLKYKNLFASIQYFSVVRFVKLL